MKTNNKIIAIFIAIAVSLSGCSPAITKETAEKELVAFMLDYIVQQEIGGTANYIQTGSQPWVNALPNSNIIIWFPPVEEKNSNGGLQVDEPIKVWLYTDNKLIEVTNKREILQKFEQTYMSKVDVDTTYGWYAFGISSLSRIIKKQLFLLVLAVGHYAAIALFIRSKEITLENGR